jgi:hypothetical protein
LDCLEDERFVIEEERVKRAKEKVDLENVATVQEVSWRLKSRETWLKGGSQRDFFSPPCKLSREIIFIFNLCIDGTATFDQVVTNDTITQYIYNVNLLIKRRGAQP